MLTTQYLPHIGGSEMAIKNLTERIPEIQFDIISSGFGGKWLMPLTGFLKGLRRRYDVIHAFQASYAGAAGYILKLFFPRTPFMVTLQEGKNLEKQSLFVRFFRRMILRKADVITAISTYLLEYGTKINPKAEFILLPNGVDTHIFRHEHPEYMFSSSRLVEKNGIDALIRAMKLLPGRKLVLAGDGPLRSSLERLARDLGVADRVSFLGTIDPRDIPDYLARASVFVRPSRSEGLGNAFLEAMAASVPVIATPVGGIPDFLKNRETGLFCKVDDPDSLAHCVQELEHDPKLRTDIIDKAFQLVQNAYDWDMIAKQYYEIIRHHSRI